MEKNKIETETCSKHYDLVLSSLLKQYEDSPDPISVDFRKLVKLSPHGTRGATHLIHTYPAKLLMHIPHFFTRSSLLSKPLDVVLDSFCGSGTVLLEAMLSGRRVVGADSNPLARLIAKVKTKVIDEEVLKGNLQDIIERIPVTPTIALPNVTNIDYWFDEKVTIQLHRLLEAIQLTTNENIRDFFLVSFSNCIKKVSFADLNVSVPVKLKVEKYSDGHRLRTQGEARLAKLKNIDVFKEFEKIAAENIKKNRSLHKLLLENIQEPVIYQDARDLVYEGNHQPDNSVQLIVTSPPYAGAQKYIRSSSLSLGWLGFCDEEPLRYYEKKNIGREHYHKTEYRKLDDTKIKDADKLLADIYKDNPLRAHIAANYLNEMRSSFQEMFRVLKPGGFLVLVIANNQVCGREFKTQEYLRSIAESFGLKLKLRLIDDIHSRGLMTKRNKTASLISCEWVLVFQK